MTRLARVVLPGVVHHITQRGVRSMDIFAGDQDRLFYFSILKEKSQKAGLRVISYCLMTNHIHLLAIPDSTDSLRAGIAETHRLYTRYFNFKTKVRGHLFQGRFYSCPLDNEYFLAVARYVERNPVRAGMVSNAHDYTWSSARFHLGLVDDDPLINKPYAGIGDQRQWSVWLESDPSDLPNFRQHFRTGRPLGSKRFIKDAERTTGLRLLPGKAGRPKNQ